MNLVTLNVAPTFMIVLIFSIQKRNKDSIFEFVFSALVGVVMTNLMEKNVYPTIN